MIDDAIEHLPEAGDSLVTEVHSGLGGRWQPLTKIEFIEGGTIGLIPEALKSSPAPLGT